MRKFLFLLLAAPLFAQPSNSPIVSVTVAPSGSCSSGLPNQQVISTGVQYSCQNGTWGAVGTGQGGGGTPATPSGSIQYDNAGSFGAATMIYIAPSGDATGAADTTAIQAQITSSQTSGAQILLGAGSFYINALTVGAPITLRGQGAGTVLNYVPSTGNAFTLAFHTSTAGNHFGQSETLLSDFTLQQKSGVTPTAGYGFSFANGGSGYMSNVHVERVEVEGMWQPFLFGTGLINNWFKDLAISDCVSTVGMELNTAVPGGDFFFDSLSFTSATTAAACSIKIDQGDTMEFSNMKLNGGAGIIFTRAGQSIRLRFSNTSIEGTANVPNCSVNFGTTGSNAASQIQFIGGDFGFSPYVFCNGATVSGESDADFFPSIGTVFYPNTAFGVTPVAGSGIGTTFYNPLTVTNVHTSTFTGPLTVASNLKLTGGTSSVTALTIPSQNNQAAASDFATVLIDGTVGATVSGAASAAVLAFRTKATATQQDWVMYAGSGTSNNNLRIYDNGNAGSSPGGDVLNFAHGSNGGTTQVYGIFTVGQTKFTATGCTSITSTAGTGTTGKFTIGAATCTVVITMNGATGLTAPTGWSCHANDVTTAAGNTGLYFSANSTTTATLTVPATAVASDVIDFSCQAY